MISKIGGGQGHFMGDISFYSLNWYDNLRNVFSYMYYDSNIAAYTDGRGHHEETTMKVIPNGEFYTIELLEKTDRGAGKLKEFYIFSKEENRFVLKK